MARSIYPDRPEQRRATITGDAMAGLLLLGFAVLGWIMFDLVDQVSVVAEGVEEAGRSVQDALDQAASAAGSVPVVGDEVADALSEAGTSTGGRLAEFGEEGRRRIRRTAVAVGLVTFVGPAGVLVAAYGPQRVRQVRRLEASRRLLGDVSEPQRRQLLATRAALTLPPEVLARYSTDPIGDLAAGRFDHLLAALFDHLGVEPRR